MCQLKGTDWMICTRGSLWFWKWNMLFFLRVSAINPMDIFKELTDLTRQSMKSEILKTEGMA